MDMSNSVYSLKRVEDSLTSAIEVLDGESSALH